MNQARIQTEAPADLTGSKISFRASYSTCNCRPQQLEAISLVSVCKPGEHVHSSWGNRFCRCVYTCVGVCVCIYTQLHIYICIYICAYVCIHMASDSPFLLWFSISNCGKELPQSQVPTAVSSSNWSNPQRLGS